MSGSPRYAAHSRSLPRFEPRRAALPRLQLPRLGLLGVALLAVLLLSGCFTVGVKAEVHPDDTVSGTARYGISKSVAALTGGSPAELLGLLNDSCDFGNHKVQPKPFEDGAFTGYECAFDGVTLAEFNAGVDGPKLRRAGGQFQLSGSFDVASALRGQFGRLPGSATSAAPPTALASLLPSDLASLLPSDLASLLPSGLPTGLASLLPTDLPTGLAGLLPSQLPQLEPSAILKSAKISFEFTFPGRIKASKGRVRGNSVTFTPDAAGRIEFDTTAAAEAGSGSGTGFARWAGLAAGLLAVAAVIGLLLHRRRRPAAQPAEAAAQYTGAAHPGAAPATNPLAGFGPFYEPEPQLNRSPPGWTEDQPGPEDQGWRPPEVPRD
jgi:hypothetical protein